MDVAHSSCVAVSYMDLSVISCFPFRYSNHKIIVPFLSCFIRCANLNAC